MKYLYILLILSSCALIPTKPTEHIYNRNHHIAKYFIHDFLSKKDTVTLDKIVVTDSTIRMFGAIKKLINKSCSPRTCVYQTRNLRIEQKVNEWYVYSGGEIWLRLKEVP